MKNLISAVLMILFITSCQKKNTEVITSTPLDSTTVAEPGKQREQSSIETCFMGNTGKDSIFISFEDNLGTITGKLNYKNFEKDSSTGTFVGIKSGDTLKLNYTFESEGQTSDEEIYFLLKNGTMIEGIGQRKQDKNQSFYADYRKIKFPSENSLKPADCKVIEKNSTVNKHIVKNIF